jgi:hypothetical protein
LFGIATTQVAQHRRAEARRYRRLRGEGREPAVAGHESQVVEQVSAQALHGRLAAAIGGLSRDDRDVLLLIALGGLRGDEVAQALGIPAGTVRHRALQQDQAARSPRLPRIRPLALTLGAVTATVAAAVAMAVVITGPAPDTGNVDSLAPRDVLLVAANKTLRAPATSGAYWHTQVRTATLIEVGTKNDPYLIEQVQQRDQWIARDPRGRSWFVTRDVSALPYGTADQKAWKRAGSPLRWHLNDQGVTSVPIEGADLVTNGQWASAIQADPGGRVLHLGNWPATVRDVQSLPADPDRLKTRLVQNSARSTSMFDPNTPTDPDALAFQVGAQLLLEVPVTAKVRAAAYRMLAALPGVRPLGRLKDPLGRPGVGVARTETWPGGPTLEHRLIIDPGTGLLLADQEIVLKGGGRLKPGSLWTYSAHQTATWTDDTPVLPKTYCADSTTPPNCH